jgi:hypothetical protein
VLSGFSLPGGFCPKDFAGTPEEKRKKGALENAAVKLSLAAGDMGSDKQKTAKLTLDAIFQQARCSVLGEGVADTDFLLKLTPEKLAANYGSDPTKVMLAVSNTYSIHLNFNQVQQISALGLDNTPRALGTAAFKKTGLRLSDPKALMHQTMLYGHEWMRGVMPLLIQILNFDIQQIKEVLCYATRCIIAEMQDAIEHGFFPSELVGLHGDAEAIFLQWRRRVELNEGYFLEKYPTVMLDQLLAEKHIDKADLNFLQTACFAEWSLRKNDVVARIQAKFNAAEQTGQPFNYYQGVFVYPVDKQMAMTQSQPSADDISRSKTEYQAGACATFTSREGQPMHTPVLYAIQGTDGQWHLGINDIANVASLDPNAHFFYYPKLAALLAVETEAVRADAVAKLCIDPLVPYMVIAKPVIVLCADKNQNHRMLVCDQDNLGDIPAYGWQVVHTQTFSEISNLAAFFNKEIEEHLGESDDATFADTKVPATELQKHVRVATVPAATAAVDIRDPWLRFKMELFSCVITDVTGQVVGVDQTKRKKLIQRYLRDGIPDFMRPHLKNAGNTIIKVAGTEVILNARRDDQGNFKGFSLYGGIANDADNAGGDIWYNREKAAIRNLITKHLPTNATAEEVAQVREIFSEAFLTTNGVFSVVAADVLDIAYPSTAFPSVNELRELGHALLPAVKAFYEKNRVQPLYHW